MVLEVSPPGSNPDLGESEPSRSARLRRRGVIAAAMTSCACLLLGCAPEPESKVKRWAADMPTEKTALPSAEDPLEEPMPEPVDVALPPSEPAQPTPHVRRPACVRVVTRACETLGVHSDECREVRDLVPSTEPPAIRAACARVIEEKPELLRPGGLGDGTSPCLLLVRTTCQRHGYKSPQCAEAKSASRMLTNARRTQACIGELLLAELKGAINPLGSE